MPPAAPHRAGVLRINLRSRGDVATKAFVSERGFVMRGFLGHGTSKPFQNPSWFVKFGKFKKSAVTPQRSVFFSRKCLLKLVCPADEDPNPNDYIVEGYIPNRLHGSEQLLSRRNMPFQSSKGHVPLQYW